jgi:hypothetical protein
MLKIMKIDETIKSSEILFRNYLYVLYFITMTNIRIRILANGKIKFSSKSGGDEDS